MEKRRVTTLRAMFWRFSIEFLAGLLLAVMIPWLSLLLLVNAGVVNYADTSEREAKDVAERLSTVDHTEGVLRTLSARIRYVVLDREYQPVLSTMSEAEEAAAVLYVREGKNRESLGKQYLLVDRGTEWVVLQYDIGSGYRNDWMQEHLPAPEYIMVIFMIANAFLYAIFLIGRLQKRLARQLNPLFNATEEIAAQNLDFEVGHSQIREFEEVLKSFSEMKERLKYSLERQWKSQKEQREQIAALAHDLKTPLTVVQGNLDLLGETELLEEQRREVKQASNAVDRMTGYVQLLIELSRVAAGYEYQSEPIWSEEWLESVCEQGEFICRGKKLCWREERGELPGQFFGDAMMLERAVMNVIGNAAEHTPEGGEIRFFAGMSEKKFLICVKDSGPGFSKEELDHGRELFFMKEHSRTSSAMHFGMGLYIADQVMQRHGGRLCLKNRENGTGAEVTLEIPVEKSK